MSREEDSTSGAATNPGVINTVSLMLPTFFTEEVEVYLLRLRHMFAIKRITDSRTLCYYVVSVLLKMLLLSYQIYSYESPKNRLFHGFDSNLNSLSDW